MLKTEFRSKIIGKVVIILSILGNFMRSRALFFGQAFDEKSQKQNDFIF